MHEMMIGNMARTGLQWSYRMRKKLILNKILSEKTKI